MHLDDSADAAGTRGDLLLFPVAWSRLAPSPFLFSKILVNVSVPIRFLKLMESWKINCKQKRGSSDIDLIFKYHKYGFKPVEF